MFIEFHQAQCFYIRLISSQLDAYLRQKARMGGPASAGFLHAAAGRNGGRGPGPQTGEKCKQRTKMRAARRSVRGSINGVHLRG